MSHKIKLDQNTIIGIELEICMENEKYEKLEKIITKKKYSKNGKYNPNPQDYNSVFLTEDPSCKCERYNKKDFISAEIISPKLTQSNINNYLNFLERNVLNDSSKFYQGETCGIHIHWSNFKYFENIDIKQDKLKYLFYRIIYFISKRLNKLFTSKEYSGRNKLYDDIFSYKLDILPIMYGKLESQNTYYITKNTVNLNFDKNLKYDLETILMIINYTKVDTYVLKPKYLKYLKQIIENNFEINENILPEDIEINNEFDIGYIHLNNLLNKYGTKLFDIKKISIYELRKQNKNDLFNLLNPIKNSSLHIYDFDNYHMEMRMFSLDDILSKSNNVNKIIRELKKFIILTDEIMRNITNVTNDIYRYDFTGKLTKEHMKLIESLINDIKKNANINKKVGKKVFSPRKKGKHFLNNHRNQLLSQENIEREINNENININVHPKREFKYDLETNFPNIYQTLRERNELKGENIHEQFQYNQANFPGLGQNPNLSSPSAGGSKLNKNNRKCPNLPAKKFKLKTKKKGFDKKMWIVSKRSDGVKFWKRLQKNI